MQTTRPRARFNADKVVEDMALKGWNPLSLARAARLSPQTVGRFLDGSVQTPKTAKKIAAALGKSIRRYVVGADQVAQADQRVETGASGAEVGSSEGQLAQRGEDGGIEVVGAHEDEAIAGATARPRELQSETPREATAEVSR